MLISQVTSDLLDMVHCTAHMIFHPQMQCRILDTQEHSCLAAERTQLQKNRVNLQLEEWTGAMNVCQIKALYSLKFVQFWRFGSIKHTVRRVGTKFGDANTVLCKERIAVHTQQVLNTGTPLLSLCKERLSLITWIVHHKAYWDTPPHRDGQVPV